MDEVLPMPTGITSRSAVSRFFKSPELLSLLMRYLAVDRNDLLTFAVVSKELRVHALRAWARCLDICLSSANKMHRFFVSNPGLGSNVRYLRLRDDIKARSYSFGEADTPDISNITRRQPQWSAAQELLGLIAQTDPTHEPTLIDVTIGLTDAGRIQDIFSVHPALTRGLVAIRVIADVNPDVDTDPDDDEAEPIDPSAVPFIAEYIEAWKQNWACIANILDTHPALSQADRPQNRGLRAFAFHHEDHIWRRGAPNESRWTPPAVPQRLWSSLSNTSQHTLRDLSLTLASDDNVEDVFSLLAHPNVRSLDIKAEHRNNDAGPLHHLDAFLDRNPGIEELSLSLEGTSADLSLRQTFAKLRWLDVRVGHTNVSDVQDRRSFAFASRHPHLKGTCIKSWASTPGLDSSSFFPNDLFPNLCNLVASPEIMEEHSIRGGRLSYLTPINLEFGISTVPFVTNSYPWAQALTGLDLFMGFQELASTLPHFKTAFGAEAMPHLAELEITYGDSGLPPRGEKSVFRRTFSALAHAPSLRVLRLIQLAKGRRKKKNLLVNFPAFPPSLEYLIFKQVSLSLSQCYRYLAPSDEIDVIGDYDDDPQEVDEEEEFDDSHWPYERGQADYDQFDIDGSIADSVKPGRLQQIPPTFCTRIARDGVWERSASMYERTPVLDHTAENPTLRVS